MENNQLYRQRILDYTKNIKLNVIYNNEGKDINDLMKEIILKNCNPLERKNLEI